MNTLLRTSLALLPTGLVGCLENEEVIVIRPDGSARVTLTASGGVGDMAGGYPVPLEPGWTPLGDGTLHWLREVGDATGGPDAADRVRQISWPEGEPDEEPKTELSVERTFASIEDLPRYLAPDSEPYRTAFLERSAELEIRRVGHKTVYVFERTYHGRDIGRLDAFGTFDDEVPDLIQEKLDGDQLLTPEELDVVVEVVRSSHVAVAGRYVRDAFEGLYTRGDASIAASELDRVHSEVRAQVEDLVTHDRLAELHATILQGGDEGSKALHRLEQEFRNTIRRSLTETLERAGVPEETKNAVLFELEWSFTAVDHMGDLQDEEFFLEVELPGRLIGGNYAHANESRAEWHFKGKALDRDVVLRAVSVLE